MKTFKVRFNLGAGENFMKWKIENTVTGDVQYLEPSEHSIQMYGTKLVNQQSTANKIYNGANKAVCAWVECDTVKVSGPEELLPIYVKVGYNPRITPHWMINGHIADKKEIDRLITCNRIIVRI